MPMLTFPCSRNGLFNRTGQAICAVVMMSMWWSSCTTDARWEVPSTAFHYPISKAFHLSDVVASLPLDSGEAVAIWQERTGAIGTVYTEDILRIGPATAPHTMAELQRFLAHPEIAQIEAAIDTTSGASLLRATHETTLERAIQRFHHFFPEEPVPGVVWMNSGFNFAVYPTEEHLAIGLDWFLGPEHPIVSTLAPHMFPQYMRERMRPDLIPATALRGWLLVHFSDPWYRTERCVDELLYWGKVMFILEQCLPEVPSHMLLDWTAEDWAWAAAHERDIWMELQPQDALFSADRLEFGRWFSEGPFTRIRAIPQDSPDRLGAYMGWRMVREYMRANPQTPFSELMAMTDYGPIIKAYRPQ